MDRPRFAWFRRNTRNQSEVVDTDFDVAEGTASAASSLRILGTFGGVFTPSFLTIIGVIMYLRFSWILSNAGLIHTVIIVVIANVITFVTALSVASIASNERMETGGAYFMISRVLGFQAGGSIGVPLYLSQALSIALYIIGFAESLHAVVPGWNITAIALITLAVLALFALVGASFMIRVQYVILVAVVVSLISIAAGFRMVHLGENLLPAYGGGESFWSIFAVFFPAVTGILAGVSMSGDLRTPEKSIPRGTLLAVAGGFIIYLLVPVMLAYTVGRDALAPSTALRDAARWPVLVTIGVMGATLSSAIGTILAAPRTLQALATDGIGPSLFGTGVGKRKEPLPALALSLAMAFVAIILGDLNVVAGVLTMFFLTTYGVLNFAAGIERAVGNPSFRPSIKVPWLVNMVGAAGCFAVMFLIQPIFTVVALAIVAVIFFLLQRSPGATVTAGGVWEGFWLSMFFRASHNLIQNRTGTGKNWRPLVQVFASEPEAHAELLTTASRLTDAAGALGIYQIVERRVKGNPPASLADTLSRKNVFFKRIVTESFQEGVVVASQAEGFAAGSSNTVMMGMPSNPRNDRINTRMLLHLCELDKNVLLFHKGRREWSRFRGPIHVWWGGLENNVRLMLVLAHILAQDPEEVREIRLATVVNGEEKREQALQQLEATSRDLRIPVSPEIHVADKETNVVDLIVEKSRESALVLAGMARPDTENERDYLPRLRSFADGLESALFVFNNLPDLRYE